MMHHKKNSYSDYNAKQSAFKTFLIFFNQRRKSYKLQSGPEADSFCVFFNLNV